jgi:heptosyltransferase I
MGDYLIIRLSALGDIVHTIPAYAALRRAHPRSRIRWVVERKGKEILDFVPGIDEIIVRGERGWTRRLRLEGQIALDFQGLIKSATIARLSGAKRRLGFDRSNLREKAASLFYTERLEPVPETNHVISKNIALLRLLGIKPRHDFEFPLIIPEALVDSVCDKVGPASCVGSRDLVIFNVGAAWPTKRWSVRNWIALIDDLDRDHIHALLIWGNAEEKAMAAEIKRKTEAAMAPFLTVREIMALLRRAMMLVSGDTFALQAAVALGVPVVGLFGPTDPARNGPFRPHDSVVYHEIPCSRCYKRECSNTRCMDLVKPEDVAAKVRQGLA